MLWMLLECLLERVEVEHSETCRASTPGTALKLVYVMYTQAVKSWSGGANASLLALLFSAMLYVVKSSSESQRIRPRRLDPGHIRDSF